jgi:ABC-type lipoprotein export system ATPase subunit
MNVAEFYPEAFTSDQFGKDRWGFTSPGLEKYTRDEGLMQDTFFDEIDNSFPTLAEYLYENFPLETLAKFFENPGLVFLEDPFGAAVDHYVLLKRRILGLQAPDLNPSEKMDLFALDDLELTRDERFRVYAETIAPVPLSRLEDILDSLEQLLAINPSPENIEAVEVLNRTIRFYNQNLRYFIFSLNATRVMGIVTNMAVAVAADNGQRPFELIGNNATGAGSAIFYVMCMTSAYSCMNEFIRNTYTVHSVVFKALERLGVSPTAGLREYEDSEAISSLIFRIYPFLINKRIHSNSIPGLMVGSAADSIMQGRINPMLYGSVFFELLKSIGNIFSKKQMNKEQFYEIFKAEEEVFKEVAFASMFTNDFKGRFFDLKKRSLLITKFINEFSNLKFLGYENLMSWIAQGSASILSAVSSLGVGVFWGNNPYMSFLILQKDVVARTATKPVAVPAANTLGSIFEQKSKRIGLLLERTRTNLNLARKLDSTAIENNKPLNIEGITLPDGELLPTNLTLYPGQINFWIGKSGSGKSTAIQSLSSILKICGIEHGVSPNPILDVLSVGSHFAKIISSLQRPEESPYFKFVLENFPQIKDCFVSERKDLKIILNTWLEEWLQYLPKIDDSRGQNLLDDPNIEWSQSSRILNSALSKYFEVTMGMDSLGHTLYSKSSLGQRRSIEIITALQNPDSKFILIDESFSNLNPTLQKRILMLFQDAVQNRYVIVTTHQVEPILHDLIQRRLRRHSSSIGITRFDENSKHTTALYKIEDLDRDKLESILDTRE